MNFVDTNSEELHDSRPANVGPINQEAKKGHKLFALGDDTYCEVSTFKGKVYASIRKWFMADDINWYRTKNGLNIKAGDMILLLKKSEGMIDFIEAEVLNPYNGD